MNSSKEIENLKAATEVLKSSREWALLENQRLTEQINMGKIKLEDLRGELDSSLNATTYYREKLESAERRIENLSIELRSALANAQQLADERAFHQGEINQLKEAMSAQDEFVSMLEGDLIVYEAHVGILRETLGASKKEDRNIIRSKAFNAKLSALELEKKEISKLNNDERLRTKALNLKIRTLEDERDQLSIRLQQYERGSERRTGDSLDSTDDELLNDTKPTFDERAVLDVGLEDSTVSETNMPSTSYVETELPAKLSHSTIQTVNYVPDEAQNDEIYHISLELDQLRAQRSETISILNNFMGEICAHLRCHSQKTLANQMENDLRTYQMSPDMVC